MQNHVCRMVPATSKKFFPEMALGFDDARVRVYITDGIKFVQKAAEGTYDAIIVDSSDPVGPAEVLFQKVSRSQPCNFLIFNAPFLSCFLASVSFQYGLCPPV